MSDLTLCTNRECVNASFCERTTAESSLNQSYACFNPNKADPCDYYQPNEKGLTFKILAEPTLRTLTYRELVEEISNLCDLIEQQMRPRKALTITKIIDMPPQTL